MLTDPRNSKRTWRPTVTIVRLTSVSTSATKTILFMQLPAMDYQRYSLILLIINIKKLVIKLLNFKSQKIKIFCWLFYIVKITEQLYISILLMKIVLRNKISQIFIKYSKVFWTMSFCSSTLLNITTMLKRN